MATFADDTAVIAVGETVENYNQLKTKLISGQKKMANKTQRMQIGTY
jgi:hypothetical protein